VSKSKRNLKDIKIYTVHSQKGGVGKTSISLTIAFLESIYHKKKTLVIDLDLTGTSLHDVSINETTDINCIFFNELLLATPNKFSQYTCISSDKKMEGEVGKLTQKYCLPYENGTTENRLFYMPASPVHEDILKIVPLISQEDHLHFFQHRLEDIIATATSDGFERIIIDTPPGLFGVSTAALNMNIEQMKKDGVSKTRLYKLCKAHNAKKDISAQTILVSTLDPPDYMALLPSFIKIVIKLREDTKEDALKDSEEIIMPDAKKLTLFFNKTTGDDEGRDDSPIHMEKIKKNLSKLKEPRCTPDERDKIIQFLERSATERGAQSGQSVNKFSIKEILLTVRHISNVKKAYLKEEMEYWCKNVGDAIGIDITERPY